MEAKIAVEVAGGARHLTGLRREQATSEATVGWRVTRSAEARSVMFGGGVWPN